MKRTKKKIVFGRSKISVPSGLRITDRSSTMIGAFRKAIHPDIFNPSTDQIIEWMRQLGISGDDIRCSYCGKEATQLDHFFSSAKKEQKIIFLTDLNNLVPSCSSCNSSKGAQYWYDWIVGSASKSPSTLGIPDLAERIDKLKYFEICNRENLISVDISPIYNSAKYQIYVSINDELMLMIQRADALARELSQEVLKLYSSQYPDKRRAS